MNPKILLRIGINTLIGAVLVFVWLQFVSIGEIFAVLKNIEGKYLSLLFVFFIISGLLRSLRLKVLLSKFPLPFIRLVYISFLSQFLSYLIPLRAGELAKGVYLSNQHQLPFGRSLVWVLIDRFMDFWMNLLIISILLLFIYLNISPQLRLTILILLLGFTFFSVFMVISQSFSSKFINIVSNILIFEKLKKVFLKLTLTIIEGFQVLKRNPTELFILIFLTFITAISDSFIW